MTTDAFEGAFASVRQLVGDFRSNYELHAEATYSEAQARKDFVDKFLIAFGWDVNNDRHPNPFEQEVKVERAIAVGAGARRADYAFFVTPNYRDARFLVEAKKPHGGLATPDNYFQAIRYGWSKQNPLVALTSFEHFHLLDSRHTPNIDTAINRCVAEWSLEDYLDRERFARLYWLISREAVHEGSLEKFADNLPKPRRGAKQRGLFPAADLSVDESFLNELDNYRIALASAFKKKNHRLDSATLTAATQRTLDRLVFMRFLEDKSIEPTHFVARFGQQGTAWEDFVAASRRLDRVYEGIVFKKNDLLDSPGFALDDRAFAEICERISDSNSPYDFDSIPIHILGASYERFLGNVIVATGKRVRIEKKPAVRKAGGVYYTPVDVVRYMVENSIGKLIAGKTPEQVKTMRFADIACGSGSFLLGIYDLLLRHHVTYYSAHRKEAKRTCMEKDGAMHLTVRTKREILLNNIFGVDIDPQAVEVTQLSLYLKLLEDETIGSTRNHQLKLHAAILPPLNANIMCGNSLVSSDFHQQTQFAGMGSDDKINAFDFEREFGRLRGEDGFFDAVIGNPPYIDSEWMTAELPETRKYCAGKYDSATGNWDIFCVFAERAVTLCKPRGISSFIVPNKLGAAAYAAETRKVLAVKNRLVNIRDYSHVPVFAVAAYPIVYSVRRELPDMDTAEVLYEKMRTTSRKSVECERSALLPYSRYFSHPETPWEIFNVGGGEDLTERLKTFPRLASIAQVLGAATVSEAYEIKELIRETKPGEAGGLRLVNSGTIDRYDNLWGRKPCRYLKLKFERPIVPKSHFRSLPGKRLVQSQSPKVIIAGMTKRLEAIADLDGTVLAGKSTSIVQSSHDMRLILALMNSSLINYLYNATFGGNKLAGGYLRIGPPQIAALPVPRPDELSSSAAEAAITASDSVIDLRDKLHGATTDHKKTTILRRICSLDDQIDQLVYQLYGMSNAEIRRVEDSIASQQAVPEDDGEPIED